ncbi:MAG: NADPH-dependent 7-cyano-7-deazaguanine reductase QueF [SAR324 cluster bacterium]|nr:NADPH-dependent 7-cyano-7-deazaguanine reductase QueF [SAR324 cluster bacterium]
MTELHEGLKALGGEATTYNYDKPKPDLLEKFPNPYADSKLNSNKVTGSIEIEAPEFTSLCPLTGQPDYATIRIIYTPDRWCVESKSLKLYLVSFRMHGEFHEACTSRIANDLVDLLEPCYLKVTGEFTPRGGMKFWPTAEYEKRNHQ